MTERKTYGIITYGDAQGGSSDSLVFVDGETARKHDDSSGWSQAVMLTITPLHSSNKAYEEALADPKGWVPSPGMVIRPFHGPWPNLPDRFHVYCEEHEDFGFCGVESEARQAALDHGRTHDTQRS